MNETEGLSNRISERGLFVYITNLSYCMLLFTRSAICRRNDKQEREAYGDATWCQLSEFFLDYIVKTKTNTQQTNNGISMPQLNYIQNGTKSTHASKKSNNHNNNNNNKH